MTKELTAEEKEIEQFRKIEKILIDVWHHKIGVCHHVDMILDWHKSECKKLALEEKNKSIFIHVDERENFLHKLYKEPEKPKCEHEFIHSGTGDSGNYCIKCGGYYGHQPKDEVKNKNLYELLYIEFGYCEPVTVQRVRKLAIEKVKEYLNSKSCLKWDRNEIIKQLEEM